MLISLAVATCAFSKGLLLGIAGTALVCRTATCRARR